jgi:hypothetical protein
MDTSKLPVQTRTVWEKLETHPLLKGFVLIGGTALTLRIGHRISKDLDFAYAAPHLPGPQLTALVRDLAKLSIRMVLNQSPLAQEEFIDAGLVLEHYQQNYIANDAVKMTFVTLDPPADKVLTGSIQDRLRVATLDEIFATKCLVSAERSKTRDWFDLYILITRHGYSMDDFYRVFESLDSLNKYDIATMRLRKCRPDLGDEGYEQLLPDAPTLDAMRTFFSEQLDVLEARLAEIAFRENDLPDFS